MMTLFMTYPFDLCDLNRKKKSDRYKGALKKIRILLLRLPNVTCGAIARITALQRRWPVHLNQRTLAGMLVMALLCHKRS